MIMNWETDNSCTKIVPHLLILDKSMLYAISNELLTGLHPYIYGHQHIKSHHRVHQGISLSFEHYHQSTNHLNCKRISTQGTKILEIYLTYKS